MLAATLQGADEADEADMFDSLLSDDRLATLLDEACADSCAAVLPSAARVAAARQLAQELRLEAASAEDLDAAPRLLAAAEAAACAGDSRLAEALRDAASACESAPGAPEVLMVPLAGGAIVRLAPPLRSGEELGLRPWPSGRRLAALLAASPALVRGRSVLELGAGCGLAGLAAAALGARVILTDTPSAGRVLAQLRRNAALNGGAAEVRALEWAEPEGGGGGEEEWLAPGERFDLILGADVMYHPEHPALLAGVLAARLARPSGEATLLCPLRGAELLPSLSREAAARGLQAAAEALAEEAGDAARGYEGGFSLIRLRWA